MILCRDCKQIYPVTDVVVAVEIIELLSGKLFKAPNLLTYVNSINKSLKRSNQHFYFIEINFIFALFADMSSLRLCGILLRRVNPILLNQTRQIAYNKNLNILPVRIYQQYQQQNRGYKKFGHKPDVVPKVTKLFHLFLGVAFLGITLDWRGIIKAILPKVDADAGTKAQAPEGDVSDPGDEFQPRKKVRKEKIGFRDRKVCCF